MRRGCLKYLKKGWSRKEGRETKIFERGNKLGQEARGGCLKRRAGNPLRNYDS